MKEVNGIIIMSAWCDMLTISVFFFIDPVVFGGVAYFLAEVKSNAMGQTTVLFITGATQIYSELKPLLGQDDIFLCQASQWDDAYMPSKADPPHIIVLDCPGNKYPNHNSRLGKRAYYCYVQNFLRKIDRLHNLVDGRFR